MVKVMQSPSSLIPLAFGNASLISAFKSSLERVNWPFASRTEYFFPFSASWGIIDVVEVPVSLLRRVSVGVAVVAVEES